VRKNRILFVFSDSLIGSCPLLGIDELIYGYLTYHERFLLNEGISCVGERLSRNGMMKETTLLELSEDMEIDQIQLTETGLVVSVISTSSQSCCPLCSQSSSFIHSRYHRTLKDAPCVGRQLQLALTVRKFFCRNPYCSQKVFTERLKTLAEPWARMTTRRRRANHRHWSSDLWQRWSSLRQSLRN
jgi:transposase